MGCQESCHQQTFAAKKFDLDVNDEQQDSAHSATHSKKKRQRQKSAYLLPTKAQKSTDFGTRNTSGVGQIIFTNKEEIRAKQFGLCCYKTQNNYTESKRNCEEESSKDGEDSELSDSANLVPYDTIQQNDQPNNQSNIQHRLEEEKLVQCQSQTHMNTKSQSIAELARQNHSGFIVQQRQESLKKQARPQCTRKQSTNPTFFNNMPMFSQLQDKLKNEADSKPKLMIRSSMQASQEAEVRQERAHSLTKMARSGEVKLQLQEILKNEEESEKQYSHEKHEENKGYNQKYVIEGQNIPADQLQNIVEQIKSIVGQSHRCSVDKGSSSQNNNGPNISQSQKNFSSQRNGATVEIHQQEHTKIEEYYYKDNGEESEFNGGDPQNARHNQSKYASPENEQHEEDKDGGDGNKEKESEKIQRKKSKKKKKRKVIETTKTTQLVIRAMDIGNDQDKQNSQQHRQLLEQRQQEQQMADVSGDESNLLDKSFNEKQQPIRTFKELPQSNDLQSNNDDQEESKTPTIMHNKKNHSKSPRPREKSKKKRGRVNNLNSKTVVINDVTSNNQPGENDDMLKNLPSQDMQHLKDFEMKWKQRNLDSLQLKKDFHSSVLLRNQMQNQDISPKNRDFVVQNNGIIGQSLTINTKTITPNAGPLINGKKLAVVRGKRRMSLDKQMFVAEGRGKIEQKYEFLETLGQGGFGLVRKVRHKITGEIRAMKVIQLESYDTLALKNISNEVEILKQLDHPNIVKIYEFYQDKKNLYLIQEYIGGGDLFEKIKSAKGGFEENIAAIIMKQILSAVLYCHQKGIVHRDLKPENILLEDAKSYNSIKIIDFGTSRNFLNMKGNQKMNQKFGTAYYIAPEVLKKNYDQKCDIWSCGVILHILLSGYPPFRGKNEREILEKIEIGYFSINGAEWKTVSREAKILLKQMLTYNPKERISAEQGLSHTWIQIQTKTEMLTFQEAQQALFALRNFQIDIKLQQAACLYIASQLLSRQEILKFKEIFNCFDLNGDGIISQEELVELLIQHLVISKDRAHKEARRILKNIDINQNGSVDFTEFVIANVSTKDILTDDKLLNAFNMLDMDGNGRITKDDLQQVFKNSTSIDETTINEMMVEADEKGIGEITFNDFKNLMLSLQKNQVYDTSMMVSSRAVNL